MNDQASLYGAMKEAVSQTLENMVFMEAREHYNQDYQIPDNGLAWAYLVIRDPVPGEVRLALHESLLKKLTGSFFPRGGKEITEVQMKDFLHELLNAIAGLFMIKYLAGNQAFELGLPEQGQGTFPVAGSDTINWALMTSEEDPIQVQVSGNLLVDHA